VPNLETAMNTRAKTTRKSGRAADRTQTAKSTHSTPRRPRKHPEAVPAAAIPDAGRPAAKAPTGKLAKVVDALAASTGASLGELVEQTGWQPHTARAALTRLRQRGFEVSLREIDGRKAYHLTGAGSQ
jgi:hypothetical protein